MRFNVAAAARRLVDPALRRALVRANENSDAIRAAIGRQQSEWIKSRRYKSPREAEFSVFSQWGEDGIIQYLIDAVPIEDDAFVEIGVEDYRESNTRFLLVNDNWRGLIVDAGRDHVNFVNWSSLRWRYRIDPLSLFVTRENVNAALRQAGFAGDIGLLSIDVDGNDYWLLESIEVAQPRIIVVEYNSVFGPDLTVSVPYDSQFDQRSAHYSRLYFGASLAALEGLAAAKGYSLVAGNSAGCNAFFVRNDVIADLQPCSAADVYVASRFRSSRDPRGNLTYVDGRAARLNLIKHLPVVDVKTGHTASIGEFLAS